MIIGHCATDQMVLKVSLNPKYSAKCPLMFSPKKINASADMMNAASPSVSEIDSRRCRIQGRAGAWPYARFRAEMIASIPEDEAQRVTRMLKLSKSPRC